jgi:hypothetical protein
MNSLRLCLLLTGTLSLLPLGLDAQPMPGNKKLAFCSPDDFDGYWRCNAGVPAALADGSFAISSYGIGIYQGRYRISFAQVDIFTASGKRQGGMGLDFSRQGNSSYPGVPDVARDGAGGVVAAWHHVARARTDVYIRWSSAPSQSEPTLVSESRKGLCNTAPSLASNDAGRVVVAWFESACGATVFTSIGVRAFGPDRLPVTPVLHIGPSDPAARLEEPEVGIDSTGRFLVVWTERTATPPAAILRGQRFDRDGHVLGPSFDFGTEGSPAVYAILPGGEVAVVWTLTLPDPAGDVAWLQRQSGEGEPVGPAQVDLGLAVGASPVAITSDFRNNLALLWRDGSSMRARLFNRDLVPQGAPFDLGLLPPLSMGIALSDAGSLLEVHTVFEDTSDRHVAGRLRRVRHEADACVRRGDLFLCDTANDGFAAEANIAFGNGSAQETPFLADWDGDGRADPCLYRSGRFFCDTGHDGGPALRSPVVGTTGDLPLLGDLNGDRRADPCVRRGAAVLCDLARDGGSKDLRIVFGSLGDKVLLGDPNGDGKDDPCLLRAGRLLCDTAHDGGLAELKLDLRPLHAEGPTLFGDVNGDGRDEACRFTGDRFVCGVYPAKGGVPLQTIEIIFGQPGDIPVLGELDAF